MKNLRKYGRFFAALFAGGFYFQGDYSAHMYEAHMYEALMCELRGFIFCFIFQK
jgi:hypothetical protein